MTPRQTVGISEYRLARAPAVLVTFGLGSCVAVTLYDPLQRLGGMAHTLLPWQRPELVLKPAKFVDAAIRLMAEDLVRQGADPARLRAKIVGGATMFEPFLLKEREGVGVRNARAARETLDRLTIPLLAEDVGGSYGRTVEFHLETGEVLVHTVRGSTQTTKL